MATIKDEISDRDVLGTLNDVLEVLRENQPGERSERSRRYAIIITEMEKVVAYFKTWVIDGEE
jgi:hypothetical protein